MSKLIHINRFHDLSTNGTLDLLSEITTNIIKVFGI